MNYYPFHIGDYSAHTARLSLIEDLAYRRMLDVYYLSERPFNGCSTDVAREIGMPEHIQAVEYILSKFFQKTETGYSNKRCDDEIARFNAKKEQASRAGKASGVQRAFNGRSTGAANNSTSVGKSATGVQPTITNNHNQEPITNEDQKTCAPQSDTKTKRASRLAADFVMADEWKAEGRRVNPAIDVDFEASKFIDFWHAKSGKDAAKLDWLATWRNWCRNARPSYRSATQARDEARARTIQALTGQSPQGGDNGRVIDITPTATAKR